MGRRIAQDHVTIDLSQAVLGLSLAIAAYLVSLWLCHDFLLDRTGWRGVELLILAAVVVALGLTNRSVLLIGLAFVGLNAVRLVRRHREYQAEELAD